MCQLPNHLLLFTKHPTPNFAKTRLIPAVGATAAAEISRKLTERAIETNRLHVQLNTDTRIIIHYYAPRDLPLVAIYQWLKPTQHETLQSQESGDLGTRLTAAFAASFSTGAKKVVVTGADCPALTARILANAFDALDTTDVVIGPAVDGGYYLLGMSALHIELFQSIPWSTSAVYQRTCEAAQEMGLKTISLDKLQDVDTAEDLSYLQQFIPQFS